MWSTYRNQVRAIVKDDVPDYQITDESMLVYANHAIRWVATVHPKFIKETLSVTDGECLCTSSVHDIEAVVGAMEYQRGSYSLELNQYYRIQDTITLSGDDTSVVVVYKTGYEDLVDDADELPFPERHAEAWMNYLVSRCLSHLAVESGDISQWDTKTDSGNPEHNPLLQLAEYYERLAEKGLANP